MSKRVHVSSPNKQQGPVDLFNKQQEKGSTPLLLTAWSRPALLTFSYPAAAVARVCWLAQVNLLVAVMGDRSASYRMC